MKNQHFKSAFIFGSIASLGYVPLYYSTFRKWPWENSELDSRGKYESFYNGHNFPLSNEVYNLTYHTKRPYQYVDDYIRRKKEKDIF
jgi:hypothetical protein